MPTVYTLSLLDLPRIGRVMWFAVALVGNFPLSKQPSEQISLLAMLSVATDVHRSDKKKS